MKYELRYGRESSDQVRLDILSDRDSLATIHIDRLLESRYSFSIAEGAPLNPVIDKHHPLLEHYQEWSRIMATSPMPFPHQFFVQFLKLVNEELKIPRDATQYLNLGGDLSKWLHLVEQRAYLLFRGPTSIAQRVSVLLDGQAVDHAVLPEPKPQVDGEPVAVVWEGGWAIGVGVRKRS